MTIINFVTALAWVWGALTALVVMLCLFEGDSEVGGQAVAYGVLAWAWLIARYLL